MRWLEISVFTFAVILVLLVYRKYERSEARICRLGMTSARREYGKMVLKLAEIMAKMSLKKRILFIVASWFPGVSAVVMLPVLTVAEHNPALFVFILCMSGGVFVTGAAMSRGMTLYVFYTAAQVLWIAGLAGLLVFLQYRLLGWPN